MSPHSDPKITRDGMPVVSEASSFHELRDFSAAGFSRVETKIAELRGDHRDIAVKVDDVDRKVDAMRELQESRWEETRRHRERQADLSLERHQGQEKWIEDVLAQLRHMTGKDSAHDTAIDSAKAAAAAANARASQAEIQADAAAETAQHTAIEFDRWRRAKVAGGILSLMVSGGVIDHLLKAVLP